MDTPWAILLIKFNDNDSEPRPRAFYDELFTSSGAGRGNNMVDFFRDVSHGNLDLSRSQVFGWYTLNRPRSDYMGSGPNPAGRQALVDWARQAATDAGVDLSRFYGVVVCCNVPTDLFGGGGRQAVCDNLSMTPSLLGQEMGHGYGLSHSRADGSLDDYQDMWDIMSTMNAFIGNDPRYGDIGPGLNASNMRSQGWLNESRVWRGSRYGYDDVIELRPLHRPDLPGFLAAQLGPEYLVEFRVQEGWDGGIPRPAVLVHRFEDGNSYLMRGTSGQQDLRAGDRFAVGVASTPFLPFMEVQVEAIHPNDRRARIRLNYRPASRLPEERPWADVFGGVTVDGGGFVVIGGRVVPVPPWDPMFTVLEQIALYKTASLAKGHDMRETIQRGVLEEIQKQVSGLLEHMHVFKTPPLKSDLHGKHDH